MKRALELAQKGAYLGEIPVGAVITRSVGRSEEELIAEAHNEKESLKDPIAHAEILAIQKACKALDSWRLKDCTLYVTLEPCFMCLGAIIASRLDRIVLGARDPKAGAIVSTYQLEETTHFNHYPRVELDVLEYESSTLLKNFFSNLRESKK